MSNKLVEHKESKEILTGNQKKILFWICFIILSIAFITVWINILCKRSIGGTLVDLPIFLDN